MNLHSKSKKALVKVESLRIKGIGKLHLEMSCSCIENVLRNPHQKTITVRTNKSSLAIVVVYTVNNPKLK